MPSLHGSKRQRELRLLAFLVLACGLIVIGGALVLRGHPSPAPPKAQVAIISGDKQQPSNASYASALSAESLDGRSLPPIGVGATVSDLAAAANGFISETEGSVGVTVIQPGSGIVFEMNANQPLPLASVSKIYIMLTLLDYIQEQGRPPTDDELSLLDAMITVSDNDAADSLWEEIGGSDAIAAFLDKHGLPPLPGDPQDDWGEATISAGEVGATLDALYTGKLLDPDGTSLALDLMRRVEDDQRWGVTAGLPAATSVAIKNGWYPADEGWRVNSAAIIQPASENRPYIVVVLTDAQPTYDYGVGTVEAIAAMVNQVLSGQN